MASVRDYYQLTKPGIIRGNVLTGIAGYCLAAQGNIDVRTLLAFCLGLTLIIAAACVCNNYYDRELDAHMKRTKNRALVTGVIAPVAAIAYAAILLMCGSIALLVEVNIATWIIGMLAFLSYVCVYTPLKCRTIHATAIGTVPGALPPVGGYIAASGEFTSACWLLFAILFFWQLAHFYAIGLYRQKEYAAARVPILPVVCPTTTTVMAIRLLIVGFIVSAAGLTIAGYAGLAYLIPVLTVALVWLRSSAQKAEIQHAERWGKEVFLVSLIVIVVTCAGLIIDSFVR